MPNLQQHRHAVRLAQFDRNTALTQLVADLTVEFRCDPARFDPQRLILLGRIGLQMFLQAVGVDDKTTVATMDHRGTQSLEAWAPVGWTHRPSQCLPPFLPALGGGCLAGLIAIAAFYSILAFLDF